MIRPKPEVWQRVCSDLLGGIAVFVVGLCAWPYTVDDAYIVARYAVRAAHAQGYTFNPGHATDGVTGPAWVLPGWIATQIGLSPVLAAKALGLICAAIAVLVTVREQRARARGSVAGWLTLLILICQPSIGGNGSSGLETGAATLAFVWAARATHASPAPRPFALGIAIAWLTWLRPELGPACALLLVIASARSGLRRAWPAWGLASLGAISVTMFHVHVGGDWLPLSWRAKAGMLEDGAGYSLRALLVMSGILGCGLAIAGARLGRQRDRLNAALLGLHGVSVVLAGGDWMPGFRLFVPVFPLYAQLAGVGAERLLRRGGGTRIAAGVALVAACAIPLVDLALRVPEWRASGRSRDTVGARIAADLHANAQRVALVDIGYLGYTSGCEVIDLGGLTDPEIAGMPGGHLDKHVSASWLRARAPDALLLHSSSPPSAARDGRLIGLQGYPVELRIARSAWLAREFRVVKTYAYAPGYHYVLLRHVAP